MNKISSLDVRVAILAYPLVSKDEEGFISKVSNAFVLNQGDDRIVSLFQNSPKAHIEPARSKIPPLLRKGHFVLIKIYEILKSLLQEKASSTLLNDIVPPRQILVPQLPHPPFQSTKPPRFFWHPAYSYLKDEYAPGCLISESKEELPTPVYQSAGICAYIRQAFPQQGILKQDQEGFVYLELPDNLITEIFPLLHDRESEMIPLYYLEPSPAHVPVILPHEWNQKKGWGPLKEHHLSFSFEMTQLSWIKPKRWPGVERVYFLNLKSPELEKLRERYLLPALIRGHEFHIAIAYKKAEAKPENPPKETFRLNVSCYAA